MTGKQLAYVLARLIRTATQGKHSYDVVAKACINRPKRQAIVVFNEADAVLRKRPDYVEMEMSQGVLGQDVRLRVARAV